MWLLPVFIDSLVDQQSSLLIRVGSTSSADTSDSVLAKDFETEVTADPPKTKPRLLPGGFQNLFSPHGRLIVSTLRDIQDKQLQLSNSITSLRVQHISLTFYSVFVLLSFAGPPLLNGRCTSLLRVVVSEMTYTVSSGTLNSTIPYHTICTYILFPLFSTISYCTLPYHILFYIVLLYL